MQVSLPSSNNFLMSPLVIFLISAFCFADLWCVCMLCITWQPHLQGIYCSFLLWHQELSACVQLLAHRGAQVETVTPVLNASLYLLTSQCVDFFWKWFPWGYTREMISGVGYGAHDQKWSALGTLLWVSVCIWLHWGEQTLHCHGESWSEFSVNKSSSELDRKGLCSFPAIAVQKHDQSGSNCSIHGYLQLENFWVLTVKNVTED